MPSYEKSQWNAIFFVLFIVVSVFYLHSLVLSVVFQVFISSASDVHKRATVDREQSMRLAFLALSSAGGTNTMTLRTDDDGLHNNNNNNNTYCYDHSRKTTTTTPPIIRSDDTSTTHNVVTDLNLIYETLQLLRPHYGPVKMKILMDIVSPHHIDIVDSTVNDDTISGTAGCCRRTIPTTLQYLNRPIEYDVFRRRIRDALGCSVRATRTPTTVGLAVEAFSIVVTVLNFIYVILLTSTFRSRNNVETREAIVGSIITFLALLEVSIRYNPLNVTCWVNPITRLNAVLDGTALFGGLVSLFGT